MLLNEKELLEFAISSGRIDISQMQAEIEMSKKKELLKQHPYSITYNEKNDCYTTYIFDKSRKNNRRQIKRKRYEDLVDIIVENIESNSFVTVHELFDDYVDRKIKRNDIKMSTVTRYQQVFNRHFVATGWNKKEIKTISSEDWAEWIEDEVSRNNLSAKGLAALTGLVKGIIQRARKRKLIDYYYEMIVEDMDVKPKKKYKDPNQQTFSEHELSVLMQYLMEHRDVQNLCLLFMIVSGIRTGEMVGLKFSDFTSNTSAEIRRAETKYRDDSGKWVYELDNPKTVAGVRTIFIPSEYDWIVDELRSINPKSEFLATNRNGTRMHTQHLRRRLYKICKDLKFNNKKSPHKMRKTFCSILLDGGFDKNLITSIMGHTDISTSEIFYHFDRKSSKKKQEMVDNIVEFKVV